MFSLIALDMAELILCEWMLVKMVFFVYSPAAALFGFVLIVTKRRNKIEEF